MEKTGILFILLLSTATFFSLSFAGGIENDSGDVNLFGLELEKLISLTNGLISLFLFVLAFVAYRRDGRKRLLFVSLAFLLFAIKSFLVSSELFVPQIEWLDPAATILEFLVLLCFFYGALKR